MKSVCLKTNNEEIISYTIRKLQEFDDIVISSNEFKIYKNVIVHYIGDNEKIFLVNFSEMIGELIEVFFEQKKSVF